MFVVAVLAAKLPISFRNKNDKTLPFMWKPKIIFIGQFTESASDDNNNNKKEEFVHIYGQAMGCCF